MNHDHFIYLPALTHDHCYTVHSIDQNIPQARIPSELLTMCFSVKKLTIAGLLLLLSVANSAPTSHSPVDKADIAAITPEVTLKRYYMLPCHGHKHHDRTLAENQCQGFHHGFPAFKLDMPPGTKRCGVVVGTCK